MSRAKPKSKKRNSSDVLLLLPEYQLLEKHFFSFDPRPFRESKRLSSQVLLIYQQYYWRATDLTYVESKDPKARKGIFPINLLHASFHHIVVSAFDSRLKGRPQFTLLGEAMASLSEFYFLTKI